MLYSIHCYFRQFGSDDFNPISPPKGLVVSGSADYTNAEPSCGLDVIRHLRRHCKQASLDMSRIRERKQDTGIAKSDSPSTPSDLSLLSTTVPASPNRWPWPHLPSAYWMPDLSSALANVIQNLFVRPCMRAWPMLWAVLDCAGQLRRHTHISCNVLAAASAISASTLLSSQFSEDRGEGGEAMLALRMVMLRLSRKVTGHPRRRRTDCRKTVAAA